MCTYSRSHASKEVSETHHMYLLTVTCNKINKLTCSVHNRSKEALHVPHACIGDFFCPAVGQCRVGPGFATWSASAHPQTQPGARRQPICLVYHQSASCASPGASIALIHTEPTAHFGESLGMSCLLQEKNLPVSQSGNNTSSHHPQWIHCPLLDCQWRGHHVYLFINHWRVWHSKHPSDTPTHTQFTICDLNLVNEGIISVDDAEIIACDLVRAKTNQLQR